MLAKLPTQNKRSPLVLNVIFFPTHTSLKLFLVQVYFELSMRRSKLEMYVDILKVLVQRSPLKLTHIMYMTLFEGFERKERDRRFKEKFLRLQ
jgi:hypothetical protein